MTKPRVGIVISATREGRFGDRPARWIRDLATARNDLAVELIDLRDYPMPFFDEPGSPLYTPPKDEAARRWGRKVAEVDGFIFVTAEYNRAPPAVLKNALDYAYKEFNRKPAAFVGYGGGGGAPPGEQPRLVSVRVPVAPTPAGVDTRGGGLPLLLVCSETPPGRPPLCATPAPLSGD